MQKPHHSSAKQVQIQLAPVIIPSEASVQRVPYRDHSLRYADFDRKFDSKTLFFDVFWANEDKTIIEAVGPSLLNLETDLDPEFWSTCGEDRFHHSLQHRIALDCLTIHVPAGTQTIQLKTKAFELEITPSPCLHNFLSDCRAIFTVSKDNDLVWIRDWAHYYCQIHGADTVVIYDNGSTRYDKDMLSAALSDVAGLDLAVVVDWPFSYGPNDHRRDATLWLSECDYCQRGAFEHARRRLFPEATGVVNADIDELVFHPDGRRLFDDLQQSETGFLTFPGVWIEAAARASDPHSRHAAYAMRTSGLIPEACEGKWAAVPSRLPQDCQWLTHNIVGAAKSIESVDYQFGHFRAISTNWDLHLPEKAGEKRTHVNATVSLSEIEPLRAALDIAFPNPQSGMIVTAPSTPKEDGDTVDSIVSIVSRHTLPDEDQRSAGYWHHRAVVEITRGQGKEYALECARKAHQLAPDVVEYLDTYITRLVDQAEPPHGEALETLESALRRLPEQNQPRIYMMMARVLLNQGLHLEAMDKVDAAIIRQPDHPGYYYAMANIALSTHEFGLAERSFNTALSLVESPSYLPDYLKRAALGFNVTGFVALPRSNTYEFIRPAVVWRAYRGFLIKQKRFAEACHAAQRALAADPLAVGGHLGLGNAYRRIGGEGLAREAFASGLKVAWADLQSAALAQYNAEEREYWSNSAILTLVEAMIYNGLVDDAKTMAISVTQSPFADLGRIKRLVRLAERLVPDCDLSALQASIDDRDAQDKDQHYPLVFEKHFAAGELEPAQQALVMAGSASDVSDHWRRLALAWDARGEATNAASCFLEAAKWRFADPQMLVQAINVLMRDKQFAEAARVADQAVLTHPHSRRCHKLRIASHKRLGDKAKARRFARDALALFPNDDEFAKLASSISAG